MTFLVNCPNFLLVFWLLPVKLVEFNPVNSYLHLHDSKFSLVSLVGLLPRSRERLAFRKEIRKCKWKWERIEREVWAHFLHRGIIPITFMCFVRMIFVVGNTRTWFRWVYRWVYSERTPHLFSLVSCFS